MQCNLFSVTPSLFLSSSMRYSPQWGDDLPYGGAGPKILGFKCGGWLMGRTVASEPAVIGHAWAMSQLDEQALATRPVTDTSFDLSQSNITGRRRWPRGWWSLGRRIKRCLSESNPVKRHFSGKDDGGIYSMKRFNRREDWGLLDSPLSQVWPSDPRVSRLKHSCHQRSTL